VASLGDGRDHTAGTRPLKSTGGEDHWAATHGGDQEWSPWQVIDLDIADGVPPIVSLERGTISGAWVLVRAFGEPLGSFLLTTRSGISPRDLIDMIPPDVSEAVRERLTEAGFPAESATLPVDGFTPHSPPPFLAQREGLLRSGPEVTVVVCTRDQPEGLAKCLQSLQEQSYPRTSILVVDNAPTTGDTHDVVNKSVGPYPTRYVLEPAPGLSNARNRSLAESQTDLVAWIDDDETADPHWICELVRGFTLLPEATFVCGVMIPGELDTPAQLWFEEYGGHSKGRGFAPATFSPASSHVQSPFFPLPPFGTGGNMAMRRSSPQAVRKFNVALGAGTLSKGAEDTKAFTDVLLAGGTVQYQPTAVTRHFHRRELAAFERQLHGYGVGLSAFYASLVLEKPARLIPLARMLPTALTELTRTDGERLGGIGPHFPQQALKAHRRGMISGPLSYARAVLASRKA
jgi:hypothetical protein